jgi:hypothetical protein
MSDEKAVAKIIAFSGAFTAVVQSLIMWGALVWICYFVYLSILALAGRETQANIAINLMAQLKLQYTLPYMVGTGGVAYGYFQRRLRKKRVAEMAEHISRLETHIDPNRSSSKLRPDGTTPPDQTRL